MALMAELCPNISGKLFFCNCSTPRMLPYLSWEWSCGKGFAINAFEDSRHFITVMVIEQIIALGRRAAMDLIEIGNNSGSSI
jgi:hypothetical protein